MSGAQRNPEREREASDPLRVVLAIGAKESVLLEAEGEHRAAVGELGHGGEERLWKLERARTRAARVSPAEEERWRLAQAEVERALAEAGRSLSKAFLRAEVGRRLGERVAEARGLGEVLEVELVVEDPRLTFLPWETLRLPATETLPFGESLLLHPNVALYRGVPSQASAARTAVPGPLRVLVAIGSPEMLNERGGLLDYERELEVILDAVEPARKKGNAYVRILNRGTVKAIREAVEAERYHALYVSCHAAPGELLLEDDEGKADPVDTARFLLEAIPAGHRPPLVVLAGCATALDVPSPGDPGGAETGGDPGAGASLPDPGPLPGLAQELLAQGVPAVLAMQTSVSDGYMTRLGALLFRALATHQDPDPLRALAEARRLIEKERQKPASKERKPSRLLGAEWATPSLYLPATEPEASTTRRLFGRRTPFETIQEPPAPVFSKDVVVRGVGDFVGRRREERLALAALRGKDGAGVLLHGLGGVGKSTLAAHLLHRLVEGGWLLFSLTGDLDPDGIFEEIGQGLVAVALANDLDEKHPLRAIASAIRRPDLSWEDRFKVLSQGVLAQLPVVLLLDNFEDSLDEAETGYALKNEDLAGLLASWVRRPGKSRILITSRYPFALPEGVERRLTALHLGPLSLAETRKLVWRLPALSALSPEDLARAHADVGGHPRTLEYLDALLAGGKARFPDVAERMEKALQEKRGIERPRAWMEGVAGDLDRALAEAVTLAVDDVLLGRLLERLDDVPLAHHLLLGASVYRLPVDEVGLLWQVTEPEEEAPDPEQVQRMFQWARRIQEAQMEGNEISAAALGFTADEIQQARQDFGELQQPPVRPPAEFDTARQLLSELGLLAPLGAGEGEKPRWAVHRWTARALSGLAEEEDLRDAHRSAAGYWEWQVGWLPQSTVTEVEQLLEARFHHHEAGELKEALDATDLIVKRLWPWGAYRRVKQLYREALTWVPEGSLFAAVALHMLGLVAQRRGSYDEALNLYRKSLAIKEELGNRLGVAHSYHQMGNVACFKGSYDEALDWYRKSLAISEELGNRDGMAHSYHQMGMVAQHRRSYDEALDWYRKSLAIREELGNRAGMADSYHQLGNVLYFKGSYDEALDLYRKSLAIEEELGNRAGMAISYHQLGNVACSKGSYDEALDWCRKSLAISEELGNRVGMAHSYSQLGNLSLTRGEPEEAVSWSLQSLVIETEPRSPNAAVVIGQLVRERELLGEEAFRATLACHLDEDSQAVVLGVLDQVQAAAEEQARP